MKIRGPILATVGYILSPLSWWNDLFVNIPLAYLVGLLFGLLSPRLFFPMVVAGYWLTNLAGILMLGAGASELVPGVRGSPRRRWIVSVAASVVYTAAILVLMHFGVLRFPARGGAR